MRCTEVANVILEMTNTIGERRVERVETKVRGVEGHVLLPFFTIDFLIFLEVHKESISYVHSEVRVTLYSLK